MMQEELMMKIAYILSIFVNQILSREIMSKCIARDRSTLTPRATMFVWDGTDYSNTGYAFKYSLFYRRLTQSAYKMLYDEHKTGT